MIPAANLDYMWSNLNARIGVPYRGHDGVR